ncbi:uncharacterized protein LOC130980443 [Arachis stenosperma]|uniref:uncharacterized protein LOC130980443 n=1 Tax=Arachis stenosperma TaxID=217475 RepID=UPI0025AD91F7|nr:uncharacterized protein LOC130980443 [Arachis stenosperma]
MVHHAFSGLDMDPRMMETLVVLISKVENPVSMKDFRPISLCNVVYKVIMKVLVNRLRPHLKEIIGPLQGGFIPGRGTPDNIIVEQEVLHFMKKTKSKKGTLVFKIDLEKVYDRVDWGFLKQTLQVDKGLWKPVAVSRGGPRISHLMFANDLLLFCKAEKQQVQTVMVALENFCRASGMKFNVEKSKALCSRNVSATRKEIFTGVSSIRFVQNLGKYLGVNLNHSRVTRATFNDVLDKIRGRLASWKGRLLNKAGRLCLLNSVVTAIPTYRMQVSLFPKGVTNKIESMMQNFLWKGQADGRGLNLVNWKVLVTPKKFGGLGIRDPFCANIALLEKLVWQLFHHLDKLWVQLLTEKYHSSKDDCLSRSRERESYVWKSICRAWDILKEGFIWCIEDLEKNFWFSKWRREGQLCQEMNYVHISDSDLRILDLWSSGQWNLENIYSPLNQSLQSNINSYNPDVQAGSEVGWCWTDAVSKVYDAHSGYLWLSKKMFSWEDRGDWLWLWRQHVPEKHKFLAWLCLQEALPTAAFRFRRGISHTDSCPRCFSANSALLDSFLVSGGFGVQGITRSFIFTTIGPQTSGARVGFACVSRDWKGRGQRGCLGTIESRSILQGELFAIWRGFLLAWDSGQRDIICETDCVEAFTIVNNLQDCSVFIDHLVLKIRDIISWKWRADLQLILRDANTVADIMARTAMRTLSPQVELPLPWKEFESSIQRDCLS